ncbi:MAG: radical SAM protein [Dehalococcoidales bacterium]|jgi:MoaA/NifB/PqqE/SkfB family radical SAM enzyme
MDQEKTNDLVIDKEGRVKLPPELVSRYNIKPGSRIRLMENPAGLQLELPSRLAKLYIEPTSRCNLDCRTCMRNAWDEPQGMMSEEIFARVVEGLKAFSPVPTVFLGGFGEPLFHPDIVKMISRLKELNTSVELITNGTLLTRKISRELIEAGLDTLWVSLDGATPESYADIRLGAALPKVLKNLEHFKNIVDEVFGTEHTKSLFPLPRIKLGIAFVAMKRNIADLPEVINIGQRYGAELFMLTNVLPYTPEMIDDVLYYRAIKDNDYSHFSLPQIDVNEITQAPVSQALRNLSASWSGFNTENMKNRCPFISKGAGAIRWDGDFSPCLPLLHSVTSYLDYLRNDRRYSRHWAVGNIKERSLLDLWNAPEHIAFRERVQSFAFAPCTTCGSCELILGNEEDCFGNTFPTCGGCLWAQGVIQCP